MDANTSYLIEKEKAEAKAEQRQEMIEAMAHDLVKPDGEYYPWKFNNCMEALQNASTFEQMLMVANFESAIIKSELKNDVGNYMTLGVVKKLVEDYWFAVAKVAAEEKLKY